jgi:hypothetical protein
MRWNLNKNIVTIPVLALSVAVHLGAMGGEKSSGVAQDSATTKVTAATSPQTFLSEQLAKFFGKKSTKKTTSAKQVKSSSTSAEKDEKSKGSSTAQKDKWQEKKISEDTSSIPTTVSSAYVPPPPAVDLPPQVTQIRQEVQRVLQLNAQIKNLQGNQVAQVQRIQEQARMHQRILNKIETTPAVLPAGKGAEKEVLLAQEKLRIINTETQRNQAILRDLQQTSRIAKKPESVTVYPIAVQSPVKQN